VAAASGVSGYGGGGGGGAGTQAQPNPNNPAEYCSTVPPLQQAQAQTGRLRGEVRSEALSDVTGPGRDNAALKVSGGEGGNGDACLTRSNMSAYDHAGCQTDALQPDLYTREGMKFRIVFCICM
jgi:hypothetical protein